MTKKQVMKNESVPGQVEPRAAGVKTEDQVTIHVTADQAKAAQKTIDDTTKIPATTFSTAITATTARILQKESSEVLAVRPRMTLLRAGWLVTFENNNTKTSQFKLPNRGAYVDKNRGHHRRNRGSCSGDHLDLSGPH